MTNHTSSAAYRLTLAAAVGAVYAVLTIALPVPQYGPLQIRFAEALTVLPFLFPAAVPGLFTGCLIANMLSPYGLPDMIVGSAATLLAALWTARMPSRWLAPLPPVLCNGVLVGGMIAWYEAGFGPNFLKMFAFHSLTLAAGELLACYLLGSVLVTAFSRIFFFRRMIPPERLK